jgi:hypothetical protein
VKFLEFTKKEMERHVKNWLQKNLWREQKRWRD